MYICYQNLEVYNTPLISVNILLTIKEHGTQANLG